MHACTFTHPQGVRVTADAPLPPIESAESLLSNAVFAPMWSRAKSLLIASEKVAQVVTADGLHIPRPARAARGSRSGVAPV